MDRIAVTVKWYAPFSFHIRQLLIGENYTVLP